MDLQYYLKKARDNSWAIGQFHISNLETLRAIVMASQNLKSPVIIGTSEKESKFIGLKQVVALVKSFREETGLPIFLNLDHGQDFEYIKEALSCGYDTVHFDGSKLPLADNIEITKEVVKISHKKGIMVEGEVGFIKGASQILTEKPEIREEDLTQPEEALEFIKKTKVDRLAVNIGTFHGIEASGEKHINFERLKEIKEKIGDSVFLVLHGGSGIREEEIKTAIESGIVKININTELRIAYTDALKMAFKENSSETTPYKYLPETIEAVKRVVEEKIKLFGSADKI